MKIEQGSSIFTTTIEEVENYYIKTLIQSIIEKNKGYEVLSMTVKDDDPELSPEDEDFGIMSCEVILFNGEEIKLYSSDLHDPESFTDTDDDTIGMDLDFLTANVFVKQDAMKIFDALKKLYFLTYGEEFDMGYEDTKESILDLI